MNDDLIDDPELGPLLGAARDELVSRPPRPDHRVDQLLGARSPSVFDHPTTELPITPHAAVPPEPAAPRRGRRLALVGAAAATLLLIAGVAAFVAQRETPELQVVSSNVANGATDGAEPPPVEPAPVDGAPAATVAEDESPSGEHHEWLECVFGAVTGAFDDDELPDLGELRSTCGEPPAGGAGGMGSGSSSFDPGEWDLEQWGLGEWNLEQWGLDELPFDLDDLDPESWGLGEACTEQPTDGGVSIECLWPPCEDDGEPFCLELDLELDGELADWLERLPDELDELFDLTPSDADSDTAS